MKRLLVAASAAASCLPVFGAEFGGASWGGSGVGLGLGGPLGPFPRRLQSTLDQEPEVDSVL